jgi:hypothetical protein
MTFEDYKSTRPWAKAIKNVVATRKMPPWFADPAHGKFINDRRLSERDLNTLVAWVDTGAKEGNPKDAPKPVKFASGWAIPEPDVIIEAPEFAIPATGTIDYQYVIVPTNFTEDRYVQFAEARPTDRAHCHHILAFIREPGSPWFKGRPKNQIFVPNRESEGGGFQGDLLAGYAPGTIPQQLRPGQAKLVKAGSDIVFQLHYTANGTAGIDRSRVGLVFSKEKPKERVLTLASANNHFEIPPGHGNYRVDSTITLFEDSTLIQMLPHMHLRGKAFEYRAVYPTGESEILLKVPNYSFEWQLSYYLADPKPLPKGTKIECTAYYDNSPNNPANPDPKKAVRFGEQSWDEMMLGFFDVAVGLDKGLMDLVRPPKPRPTGDE